MLDLPHLRAWSYRRQHLDRSARTPLEALQRVVAVHSTHPPAPLSLLARTPGFGYPRFEALEREKQAVGFAAMRGSVHLVPSASAACILSATRATFAQLVKRLGDADDDSRTFAELRVALLPRLREPVPGAEIRERLGLTDREFRAVRLMSRSGDVLRLSTNPRSDRLEYVSTEGWLGAPFPDIDKEEALDWLAGAYFDGFGPARIRDSAWWAGISQRDAKVATESLPLVDLGDGLLLARASHADFAASMLLDPAAIAIIPKWDAYTVGYAPDGRRRFVEDEHLPYAYSTTETRSGATTGDGFPLILRDGRAVARWEHRFSGKRMSVSVLAFPSEMVGEQEIAERMQEIGHLMGCETVAIEDKTG